MDTFKHPKLDLTDAPEAAEAALEAWVKGGRILHLWNDDNLHTTAVFVVVEFKSCTRFLRAFQMGDDWAVSVDQEIS